MQKLTTTSNTTKNKVFTMMQFKIDLERCNLGEKNHQTEKIESDKLANTVRESTAKGLVTNIFRDCNLSVIVINIKTVYVGG